MRNCHIFASAFPVEGHSEEDIDMVRKQQDSAKGPACIGLIRCMAGNRVTSRKKKQKKQNCNEEFDPGSG